MEKTAPHQTAGVELDSRAPPSYQDPNANNANVPSPGPVPVNSPPPVHSMPPQGQYVPQQQGQQPNVPLNMLQSQSVPVVCPSCGTYGPSNAMAESGGFTHAIAALVCFCTCLGCIPYCIDSLKDVHHKCSKCGMPLATFHRSGRTEVHAYART